MTTVLLKPRILFCLAAILFYIPVAFATTETLGNGFYHHGVATPVSNHRGVVSTIDGEGRDVVLTWLFDHRGGYALLMIDAETGKSEQIPMSFAPRGDCPYASILSSKNRFYTHFNSHFTEFDPVTRSFTFTKQTKPQMAMGMTEDDNGIIWSVTYPDSGVVSFDPETREFKDYGHVYKQNWRQYQRYVAADDTGWIYFGIGSTASQIIAFDPRSGKAEPMIPEAERVIGSGYVCRYADGRVYGHASNGGKDSWYMFYEGTKTNSAEPAQIEKKSIITGSQGLFHRKFPSGKHLKTCDLVDRVMVVEDPKTGESNTLHFDYTSEGAHIMGVAVAPDGTICGGTAFPMRFFVYNPETDAWTNRASYGQLNTVVRQGDFFFSGGYGGGFLLQWDPSKEWASTVKGKPECNPLFLTDCTPTIHRPHKLLAHPDGKRLVLAGTPGYGYTGGGLLFWDIESQTGTLVEHKEIIPQHATMSLAALPDNKLLGGTTTAPGTGGEKKATEAELYIMDMETKEIEWHEAVFPGIQEYTDLCSAPNGFIYGIADRKQYFVFDPKQRKIIYEEDTVLQFGPSCSQQGPRVFVPGAAGKLYMLFRKGIACVNLTTHKITMLAESPVPIGPGGDIRDGRIYFGSGSHLYSYQAPESDEFLPAKPVE